MPSANEDVLLRSDGATPAVGSNVQHSQHSETNATSQFLQSLVEHPQPTRTNDTAEENRSGRQLRLTRRERDYRTRSHRDQLSTTLYHSTRFRHSSSTSHRHNHHRHHEHHPSTSRDRSYERTRRPESRSKFNSAHDFNWRQKLTQFYSDFRKMLQMWSVRPFEKRLQKQVQEKNTKEHKSIYY